MNLKDSSVSKGGEKSQRNFLQRMLPGRRVPVSETTMSKTMPGEYSNEEAKVSHGDEESDILQVIIGGETLDRDSFYPNHQMKRIVIEEEDKVDITFTSD